MIFNKPNYRIRRCKRFPTFYDGHTDDYVLKPEYMPVEVRHSMVRALDILISDLRETLYFIEPDNRNLRVFSTRIYELLLRAATEFESNCKGILLANGYQTKPKDMKMPDYRKLDSVLKLSEYEVLLSFWNSEFVLRPVLPWKHSQPLVWYDAYNQVKHNRVESFHLANMRNALNAIAAVACIVYAQLGPYMQSEDSHVKDMSDGRTSFSYKGLEIIQPSFEEDEYNIKWLQEYEFERYAF